MPLHSVLPSSTQVLIHPIDPPHPPGRLFNASEARTAGRTGKPFPRTSRPLGACTLGWLPLCPHMNSAHMDADLPDLGDAFWLRAAMELMERCDAVVLIEGWDCSAGTLAEIARADEMRLPVFRSSDLLPSAAEFIDYLFAKEGEPAWASTYPPPSSASKPNWPPTASPPSNPFFVTPTSRCGRCASPGAMVCSGKIVRYFADFRPLEQQP